jgi:hypothetical protein
MSPIIGPGGVRRDPWMVDLPLVSPVLGAGRLRGLMAMYDAPPIETRRPITHEPLPVFAPGDHARRRDGAFGTVVRVAGDSVVLRMDEPFLVAGLSQRIYYSNVHELTKVESVGRMGARDLFHDDEDDEDDE